MANPIWKDYYVNLGTTESIQFRILVGEEVIYTGKAWKRPGENYIQIRINDIVADYLLNVFPTLDHSSLTTPEIPTFTIQKRVEVPSPGWLIVRNVQFTNDWSYDYDFDPATMGMSHPINARLDQRQWIVYSVYEAASLSMTIRFKDGSTTRVTLPVGVGADFNSDFSSDFLSLVTSSVTGTAVFNLWEWQQDIDSVTIGNREYKVVNGCSRYTLYYVNAYGGWDSLLIEGNHSEVDNLTRHMRETDYDNRSIQNRGVHNYVNEVEKNLTLHTSWLSDEESSRMHHLLNSTQVFLGDITTGVMIPVVLTDTTTEYKTYKGNGGKLVNYTINVTIAQDRTRR